MEETRIIINSLGFTLTAGIVLLSLFALEGIITIFILPLVWVGTGFSESRAVSSLGYSPGKWSEAYWERAKLTLSNLLR